MPTLSQGHPAHNSLQRDIKHPSERISAKISLQKREKGKKMEKEEEKERRREGEKEKRKMHTSFYEERKFTFGIKRRNTRVIHNNIR